MEEQLLFENYMSHLQQLNVLSPSSGVAGGPSETTPNIFPDSTRLDLVFGLPQLEEGEYEKLNAVEENTRRELTGGPFALPTTIEFLYGKTNNVGPSPNNDDIYIAWGFGGDAIWKILIIEYDLQSEPFILNHYRDAMGPTTINTPLGEYNVESPKGDTRFNFIAL